ncbi:MAG: hypothetical protein K2N06_05780 [Oscillospiraceae bacterium]|nr:hypothetical protein [Oscillospiraceae bacterium]
MAATLRAVGAERYYQNLHFFLAIALMAIAFCTLRVQNRKNAALLHSLKQN